MTALVLLMAASPVAGALVARWLGRPGLDLGLSSAGVALAVVILGRVVVDGPVEVLGGWVTLDRVAGVWCVFALAIVLAVRQFARRQLAADPERERFHLASAVAAAAGVALFSAGNLVALALAAVATSLAAAWLIGSRTEARPTARRVWATLLVGDLALVVGVVVVIARTGEIGYAALGEVEGVIAGAAAVAVVVAALVRCAQPPAHGWLAQSLVAPTPASALLHAGLVNAGGVILIRSAELVSSSAAATAMGLVGATTGIVVGVGVLRTRSEVKTTLVWSTVAQMGFMLLQVLVGLGAAAAAHLVAHGAYKASLFLWSGSGLEHPPAPHLAPGRRPAAALAAPLAVAAVVVAAGVVVTGFDLGGHGGAAVLVPLFAFATVATVLAGPAGLFGGTARRGLQVTAVVSGVAVAYLALIATFESWLGLPDATPAGAGWLAVAAAAAVAAGVALTSTSTMVPRRLAQPLRARLIAVARRPTVQTLAVWPRPEPLGG